MVKKMLDFGFENDEINKGLNDVWKVRANKDMEKLMWICVGCGIGGWIAAIILIMGI